VCRRHARLVHRWNEDFEGIANDIVRLPRSPVITRPRPYRVDGNVAKADVREKARARRAETPRRADRFLSNHLWTEQPLKRANEIAVGHDGPRANVDGVPPLAESGRDVDAHRGAALDDDAFDRRPQQDVAAMLFHDPREIVGEHLRAALRIVV